MLLFVLDILLSIQLDFIKNKKQNIKKIEIGIFFFKMKYK